MCQGGRICRLSQNNCGRRRHHESQCNISLFIGVLTVPLARQLASLTALSCRPFAIGSSSPCTEKARRPVVKHLQVRERQVATKGTNVPWPRLNMVVVRKHLTNYESQCRNQVWKRAITLVLPLEGHKLKRSTASRSLVNHVRRVQ